MYSFARRHVERTIAQFPAVPLCYTRIGYRSGMVSPSAPRSSSVNHKRVNIVPSWIAKPSYVPRFLQDTFVAIGFHAISFLRFACLSHATMSRSCQGLVASAMRSTLDRTGASWQAICLRTDAHAPGFDSFMTRAPSSSPIRSRPVPLLRL